MTPGHVHLLLTAATPPEEMRLSLQQTHTISLTHFCSHELCWSIPGAKAVYSNPPHFDLNGLENNHRKSLVGGSEKISNRD